MNRARRIAVLEVTLAVGFWGASFVATKIATREVLPFTLIWLRFGIGVFILGGAVWRRRQFRPLPLSELPYFALLGFLGVAFHQWLQVNGLLTAQATTTAWIVATTPVFIALLSALFLQERLGWSRAGGIALAALGVLLVVSRGELSTFAAARFGEPGDMLILLSAINWAVFTVLSRRGLGAHPAALMMFYVMGFGWLLTTLPFLAGPALAGGGHSPLAAALDVTRLATDGWTAIAFLGIFCSGFAYIFWYDALQNLGASQVGAFLYLEPLVTLIVAAVILSEKLTLAALVGGAAILFGVWLVNRPPRSRPPSPGPAAR